jgi:ABC-type oligopeptide transport system substrate-binding subunit
MIYVKNEYYWNSDALGPDSFSSVLMDDDSSILSAYEKGEILFADSLPNA